MKNIVLCADGTWNSPPKDTAPPGGGTNVWKLYCALKNTDTQLKYYDSGVGTDGTPLDHLNGGAMGIGLLQKIQDLYSYLSHVYDAGDRIYLFGFSRGAYTARSLGGMIAGFGIPMENLSNSTTPEIFAAYRETDKDKRKALKQHLTDSYGLQDVEIAMVGVWDTVGELGIPVKWFSALNEKQYGFLDTTLSDCIQRGFHAVSIDERRSQFAPTLWTNKDGSYRANDARVEQVWFAGVHTDVGGGYKDGSLAEAPLGWMMQKGLECGLQFTDDALKNELVPPPACAQGPAHDEWKLIPWGAYKHRTVPPNATLANSVLLRAADATSKYKPGNLQWKGTQPDSYAICDVLPYKPPVWP